jgi:hypothetical protein
MDFSQDRDKRQVVMHTEMKAGSEVITAVSMSSMVFRDVTPCSSERARHFGGTYRLHLDGHKDLSQAEKKKQKQAAN